MTISTIVLAITGALIGGGGWEGEGGWLAGGRASPTKDKEGSLKKWLDRLVDALRRLAGKAVEASPAIVESVVGAVLSF